MSVSLSVVSHPLSSTGTAPFEQPSRDLVLLIEDDDLVAEIMGHMLSRIGKRLLRARTGREGAQLFEARKAEIAIVMLDCFLPDGNGVALSRVLRRHSPLLPIIVTSGADELEKYFLSENAGTVFLAKPFFPRQVEELLDRMLRSPAAT